jgi:hypothetical protein
MLGGALWIASGIVSALIASGRGPEALGFTFLDEMLYVVALVGTLGGITGLHARQAPGYGWLGTAGFLAAFIGTLLVLVGLMLSFLLGGIFGSVFLDWVMGVGLWSALLGFLLLGAATLRLGALPRWCGSVLTVCLPLAITLGDYGGGAVLGVTWLALGYVLLSQRDVSALIRSGRR